MGKVLQFPLPTCNLCQLEEALKLASDAELELSRLGKTISVDARAKYVKFLTAKTCMQQDLEAIQACVEAGELQPSEASFYREWIRERWLGPVMQSVKRG